jgi:hypothetical protein
MSKRFSSLARLSRSAVFSLALTVASSLVLSGCEAIGLKANIVSKTTKNGKTTTKRRQAKNWGEFEEAMGEVGTDFSSVAKDVGATTALLVKKLVEAPPPGKVTLSSLEPSLKKFEGNKKYDFLAAAAAKPDAAYDFTYVKIGMSEYDNFFKSSAEMYSVAFQLTETARRIRIAGAAARDQSSPDKSSKIEDEIASLRSQEHDNHSGMVAQAKNLVSLWQTVAPLGTQLAKKAVETAEAGAALVASAPKQITNPKLVLHIKLIVKGLEQSVSMVKDTAKLLAGLALD